MIINSLLILFLSIIFSYNSLSLPQVLILKKSFKQGEYTYHVFDVYDGQIYRGVRITYTHENGEGGLWRNYYYWKMIHNNSEVNKKHLSDIDIKLINLNDKLTLVKNNIYENIIFVDIYDFNGKLYYQAHIDPMQIELNIYNLNLPNGVFFINIFNQEQKKVIKFIHNS